MQSTWTLTLGKSWEVSGYAVVGENPLISTFQNSESKQNTHYKTIPRGKLVPKPSVSVSPSLLFWFYALEMHEKEVDRNAPHLFIKHINQFIII